MLCSYCSTPNPETNRFCGECGQPLVRQQVTVPAEIGNLPERKSHHEETTISGPSFLGLTESADDQSDYLLEDEQPHHSHTGWVVFSAIAIVVLAVVGWLEWKAIKTGEIEVPWKSSTAAAEPTAPATPSESNENASAGPASTEAAANPSDKKPEADKDASSAPAKTSAAPDAMLAAADAPKQTDTTASDAESDTKVTREAQARIAGDAGHRREQADAGKSDDTADDNSSDAQAEKPTPKAKSVKATELKPDPRQDRMLVTGEKYLYGRGVPQDCNQALIYFKAAAEKNNAPAMSHLGAMYASGHCVTQNKVAAYKWFSRASESEPSNQWISRSLNMLWRDMSSQERASLAR